MKVLQIGKFYPIRGGVEKVIRDLTRGLGEKGVKVDMLCAKLPLEGFPRRTLVLRLGPDARIVCVPAIAKIASTMISPAMVFALRGMVRDCDIVHIHHPDPMAALALFLSGWKGKVVLHYHSDILRQKGLLKLFLPLQSWLLRRADRIVGTTPLYVAESPYLRGYQQKTTYLPIGIEALRPDPDLVAGIRARYEGKKIVWSLGRLVEYKGYGYLISAMKGLPGEYVLVIGGEGPLRSCLERQIVRDGVEGRVHLIGRQSDEDCAAWFAACDVFALPSVMRTEAFGIVQVEAMSLGKPVVSTRIPGSGVSWVNRDGESGLTVPVCDSASLSKAIAKVCAYGDEYGRGAGERYKKLFTFEGMISGCIKIYEGL